MDFIADLHTHTLASTHAYSTVTENAKWASEHGIRYLGVTDHSTGMPDSPHEWHFYNLKVLPDELFGVRLICGMEADITDDDGSLDIYDDYMYSCLKWVNVSMHDCVYSPRTKAEHTRAYLGALQNPYVDALCHTESAQFDYDFDAVCRECAAQDRLMEVNVTRLQRGAASQARYMRILEACEKYGTNIVVNSDAHFYTMIGEFQLAERLISEIGFPEKLVLNLDCGRVEDYLKKRAERISANK